ncbi:MAG: hypothetical protein KF850_23505 [Labilithrix sp.]|nr:hypothetical protein [Labilithrix sp.]
MVRSFRLTSLALLGFALAACTTSETGSGGDKSAGGDRPAGGDSAAPAAQFFLPTGDEVDNTSAPTIEIDPRGGIHSVYPAYAGGGAYYAYCPSDCAGAEAVKVVRFDTDGTVGNAMLALDANGKPQVLLSAYADVYYASCADDCTTPAGWTTTSIVTHGGDKEVTGEAFALDAQGRPRFLMHTYVAYLGIGQKPPKTEWVACDADCNAAGSWTANVIGEDIFERATLRFDAKGNAHVAAVAHLAGEDGSPVLMGAYQLCAGDCAEPESWSGPGFAEAYASELEAISIKPQISLALTKAGQPRVLFLAKDDAGAKKMMYLECDDGCTAGDPWGAVVISGEESLSSGFDLALDQNDHPRVAFALSYNIGIAYCNDPSCVTEGANWDLSVVERGSDMPPDTLFLEPNCTVGAWFLHDPSIALTATGQPRVGYQARDISGGWKNPDPTKPGCTAGTDMTWARLAIAPSAL